MTIETALLSNELTRIGTYIGWPRQGHESRGNVKPSVDDLVKAGFYYTGNGDIVRCFSCGLEIKVWKQHLDPYMVHAARNPSCAFIVGSCNDSRPNYVASPGDNDAVMSTPEVERPTSENPSTGTSNRNNVRTSAPPVTIPCNSSTTVYNIDTHQINHSADCQHSSTATREAETLRSKVTASHGLHTLSMISSTSDLTEHHITNPISHPQRAASDTVDLRSRTSSDIVSKKQHSNSGLKLAKFRESEEARFQTFKSWTGLTSSRAKEFAQAGFMYIGPADRVSCVFCGGILKNWKSDDSPLEEHHKHYPECGFAVETLSATLLPRPRHSKYRSEPVRLSSFYDWDPSWNPKPAALAKAGFFYSGSGDRVRCFFCNGGLCKWEPHDDPWREHARWFPKCPYVKQSKGQSFISAASSGMTLARRQAVSLNKTDNKFVAMENNLLLLTKENKLMKKEKQCKVCLDREVCVTFIPCGHLVCCLTCASGLQLCPICRAKIICRYRIYMS